MTEVYIIMPDLISVFQVGERNEREDSPINFSKEHNSIITNIFFQEHNVLSDTLRWFLLLRHGACNFGDNNFYLFDQLNPADQSDWSDKPSN